MKTIFKEGMKVYDQVNFPDMEGRVVEIDLVSKYPVTVSFGIQEYDGFYSLDGTERNSFKPTLSTKPYEVEFKGFEQKAPVPTYEEAVDWLEKNSKDRVIYADEAYINEEYEVAFEALKKLTILREYYNEGWKPNWEDQEEEKYCIVHLGVVLCVWTEKLSYRPISFKTPEIRNRFFKEQQELLEIAKPLL
jgi:hypothetical protein